MREGRENRGSRQEWGMEKLGLWSYWEDHKRFFSFQPETRNLRWTHRHEKEAAAAAAARYLLERSHLGFTCDLIGLRVTSHRIAIDSGGGRMRDRQHLRDGASSYVYGGMVPLSRPEIPASEEANPEYDAPATSFLAWSYYSNIDEHAYPFGKGSL